MAKKSTMVLTTLAATGAGYVAGVLFAPKSGTELRQQVKGKAKVTADKVTRHMTKGRQKIDSMTNDAGKKMKEMSGGMPAPRSTTIQPAQ